MEAASRDAPALPSPTSPSRRGRGISFSGRSDKSHHSSGSGHKRTLSETHEEKARRVLHTKADPTLAMNEDQPAVVALQKSNLASLREAQYKDQWGNIITDPDLSNPTRPRLERPLDTIRSFEAAIDGSYNSRRMSSVNVDNGHSSRPASYYGPNTYNRYNESHNQGAVNSRPDSLVDNYGSAGPSAVSPHYPVNQYGGRGGRPRYKNRMSTDNTNGNGGYGPNFYPNHSYQQSNDNMTAGSGSNNTDQWGNSTDPSSVNSSLDRLQQQIHNGQQQKPDIQRPMETYGFNGFGSTPVDTSFQDGADLPPPPPPAHGDQNGYMNGANGYHQQTPPQQPATGTPISPLTTGRGTLRKVVAAPTPTEKKRSSWFKRPFSKS